MLENALTAGILAVGGNVIKAGVIPTPAVAFLTRYYKADAGIVISASHNTFEYNGIKFFNSEGFKLDDLIEEKIEDIIISSIDVNSHITGDLIGKCLEAEESAAELYAEHLIQTADYRLDGKKVVLDCANGASAEVAPKLFPRLGANCTFLGAEPDGCNINDGCGSTHLDKLAKFVKEGGFDCGIAFDGDADRCLLVDEKGNIIDGDKVLAVCGRSIKRKGGLNGNAIVATVMSNLGLHEFCRKGDYQLVCTDVGDRHVLEKMIECGYMIGGEQSGHTIFREFATTGDGELTALQFIQAYCEAGVPASELVSCCAQYPQELINVPVSAMGGAKQRIMADDRLWEQVRFQEELLHGDGRILVRPSGTEALIRVMVEAKTVETAHNVAQALADLIKTL